MRVAITMPVDDGLTAPDYLQLAELAEQCGYDMVLAGEVAGPEAFSLLGMIAARTSRIRLASGIVGAYVRPPTLAAMGFATLSSLAPGRVVAGIGASSPIVVNQWHGLEFSQPLVTVGEFIEVLREAMSGRQVDFSGKRMQTRGFRPSLCPPKPVQIMLAAMNPRMLRLAGQVADGAFITWTPPEEVSSRLRHVRDGEAAVGREPGTVWSAASFWAYCGPRLDEAMERMRRFLLQYAMVPTHRDSFGGTFAKLDEATAAWCAGDRKAALRLVDDETVHTLCAIGDADVVADRVRALNAAGIDLPIALTPGAVPGDLEGARTTVAELSEALGLHA